MARRLVFCTSVWDNMKVPIVHGTGQELLDQALGGHYETTQWPGELGIRGGLLTGVLTVITSATWTRWRKARPS